MRKPGSSKTAILFVLITGLAISAGVQAGPVSWFFRSPLWPWGWPDTLLVTGNFAEPRLLAELAQYKTKQPLIVVSPEIDGHKIFYLPYKEKEALDLTEPQYLEFVETMLRPKKIVFLGGQEMIPKKYIDPLRENYTCIVLEGNDWERNAKQLGKIMRSSLRGKYAKARKKVMKAKSHREAYDPAGETIQMPSVE